MSRRAFRLVSIPAVAMAVGLIAGCASPAMQSDELRTMVEEAQSTADQALRAANEANSKATDASQKADKALSVANDAQACCQRNSSKIDRLLEKSMMK
jgi:murein lipoprotein